MRACAQLVLGRGPFESTFFPMYAADSKGEEDGAMVVRARFHIPTAVVGASSATANYRSAP